MISSGKTGADGVKAVVLDRPKAKTSATHYTVEHDAHNLADTSQFMCLESVCKDTNADGMRQLYENPVVFDTNPEWNGSGCKCATKNKKLNLQLHMFVDGVWRKQTLKNPPTFCCNKAVDSNGKCKRHNKGTYEEWTELGAGWTAKAL